MGTLTETQIKVLLTTRQGQWVRDEAKRRGASYAQIIRDAVQLAMDATRRPA
jgi:hypothetical protein